MSSTLWPCVRAPEINSFPAAIGRYLAEDKRRARLLRFVNAIGDGCSNNRFTLKIGHCKLSYSHCTTDYLERLSAEMVEDFWSTKRINRQNREAYAARKAVAA